MQITEKLAQPGEHSLLLHAGVGTLDAKLTVPDIINTPYVAILGHPHSLQGGTMNNKVVTTLARTFKDLGIPALRFNFRGVEHSEGVYDEGVGESEDMLSIVAAWQQEQPSAVFIFAGFSFGSYVVYRTAAQCAHQLLITIAPPVHHYNYKEFSPTPAPWLIIQGEEDEVVPPDLVFDFAMQEQPELQVMRFANTTHFFHGQLLELKTQLTHYLTSKLKHL